MLFATMIDDGPFEALDDHLLDIHFWGSLRTMARLLWIRSISADTSDSGHPLIRVVVQSLDREKIPRKGNAINAF